MLGSRSSGAVHPWALLAHPTHTCGIGVGKAEVGWAGFCWLVPVPRQTQSSFGHIWPRYYSPHLSI